MYRYRIDHRKPQSSMNFTLLLQLAKTVDKGPIPNLFLANLNITRVNPEQTCKLSFGTKQAAIAYGLITCAAVVIASPKGILLYHAGSGSIPKAVAKTLLLELEITAANAMAAVGIYAVPGEWDNRYQQDAQELVDAGIPDNNVVLIEKVGANFGINQMGQVGIPC